MSFGLRASVCSLNKRSFASVLFTIHKRIVGWIIDETLLDKIGVVFVSLETDQNKYRFTHKVFLSHKQGSHYATLDLFLWLLQTLWTGNNTKWKDGRYVVVKSSRPSRGHHHFHHRPSCLLLAFQTRSPNSSSQNKVSVRVVGWRAADPL